MTPEFIKILQINSQISNQLFICFLAINAILFLKHTYDTALSETTKQMVLWDMQMFSFMWAAYLIVSGYRLYHLLTS